MQSCWYQLLLLLPSHFWWRMMYQESSGYVSSECKTVAYHHAPKSMQNLRKTREQVMWHTPMRPVEAHSTIRAENPSPPIASLSSTFSHWNQLNTPYWVTCTEIRAPWALHYRLVAHGIIHWKSPKNSLSWKQAQNNPRLCKITYCELRQ